jgi:hypothetical protein
MPNPVKVEFLTRITPASDDTMAQRRDVVRRLDDLNHLDASTGEVNTTTREWIARIGGVDVPLLDWSVQKLDDGKVAVSLVAVVDAVAAGDELLAGGVPQGSVEDDGKVRADERHQMVLDRLEFAHRQMGPEAAGYVRPASPLGPLGEQVADNAAWEVKS